MSGAFDTFLTFRLTDGRRVGAAASPLQLADARAVLDPGDGPHRSWHGRPRGYAKTTDAAGYLLADMIVGGIPPDTPAYVIASDRAQGSLVLDSLNGFVRRSGLGQVAVGAWQAQHRNTGARIEILAADDAGAYGLRPSWVVADELAQWPDTRAARRVWEALSSAIPKVRGARLVVATTAGSPGHWAHKVYRRALDEPKLWRVSDTHEAPPWIAPELIDAERRALTESAFARLWENRWVTAEDALVSGEDLEAACVLDGPLAPRAGTGYICTLDVGLVHDRTVAVVAHAEPTEGAGVRVVVDQLLVWQGSRRRPVDLDEVTETVAELHGQYPGRIVVDPAKAEHLLQRLRKRGLAISQFNFTATSVGLLAGSLVRALRTGTLLLPRNEALMEELRGVRIVENSAGVPRLDHDRRGHDDRAVALALAVHHLTDGRRSELRLRVPVGRIPSRRPPGPAALVEQRPPTVVPPGERPDPSGGWRPGSLRPPPGRYTPRGRPW